MAKTLFSLLSLAVIFLAARGEGCEFGYISNGTACEECGLSEVQTNIKIVGGVEAAVNSYPASVLIMQNVKGDYIFPDNNRITVSASFICGATLISHYTILTAGHCIKKAFSYRYKNAIYTLTVYLNEYYPTWESMFSAFIGFHDVTFLLEQLPTPTDGLKMSISNVIVYPSYDDETTLNDIAVLITQDFVPYTRNVKPACLPELADFRYPKYDQSVLAAGWGKLKEGDLNISPRLFNVKLTVYNETYCSAVYPEQSKNWNSQICVGNYSGFQDTCQGDSGSAVYRLEVSESTTRQVIAGITSYGRGCGRPRLPGIYTRVSYFLEWIYSNLVVEKSTTTTTTKAATTTALIRSQNSTAPPESSEPNRDRLILKTVKYLLELIQELLSNDDKKVKKASDEEILQVARLQ